MASSIVINYHLISYIIEFSFDSHFMEKQQFIFGVGEKINKGEKNIWETFLKKSSEDGFVKNVKKKPNNNYNFKGVIETRNSTK